MKKVALVCLAFAIICLAITSTKFKGESDGY
jgi:hypothetical protein